MQTETTGKFEFPCTKCGACCKRADLVEDFPLETNEDGSCVNLKEDNTCGIYEDRPEVCRVKDHYFTDYEDKLSFEEYMLGTAHICNTLQEVDGIDEEYRVDLENIINQLKEEDNESEKSTTESDTDK